MNKIIVSQLIIGTLFLSMVSYSDLTAISSEIETFGQDISREPIGTNVTMIIYFNSTEIAKISNATSDLTLDFENNNSAFYIEQNGSKVFEIGDIHIECSVIGDWTHVGASTGPKLGNVSGSGC